MQAGFEFREEESSWGTLRPRRVCGAVRYDICGKEGWNNNKENMIFCCLAFEQHFVIFLHLILIFMPVVECVCYFIRGQWLILDHLTRPTTQIQDFWLQLQCLCPDGLHWKDEVNSTRPGRCREECMCWKVLLTQDWEKLFFGCFLLVCFSMFSFHSQ